MPTITLTVVGINAPKPNGKKSKIVGTNNETVYAFPDKAAKFTLGRTYEIDCSTSEYNGKTLNHLESFTEVEAKTPAATLPSQGGGAPFRTPEQMFVSEILTAYIAAGRLEKPSMLLAATVEVRKVWHHTFGDTTFEASEAGRRAA
jgi:hypothetical protein